jgi:hypothetical protein
MIHAMKYLTFITSLEKLTHNMDELCSSHRDNAVMKLFQNSVLSEVRPVSLEDLEDSVIHGLHTAHGTLGHNTLKTAFNEGIRERYKNGETVTGLERKIFDNGSQTLFSTHKKSTKMRQRNLNEVNRLSVMRANKNLRSPLTSFPFIGILKLETLIVYAKEVFGTYIETLRGILKEMKKVDITFMAKSGFLLPQVDKIKLNTIDALISEWIDQMEKDLVKYPYEQLFRESDLVSLINVNDIFRSVAFTCPIGKKPNAIVIYEKYDENGHTKGDTVPIPGCSNKWLNYLSRRLQYYFLSDEYAFYNRVANSFGFTNLGKSVATQQLLCSSSPFSLLLDRCNHCNTQKNLLKDPLFQLTFCGDICHDEWFLKHVLTHK